MTWGRNLLHDQGDRVEMVGLCDINSKRVEASKRLMGVDAPTFTELDRMLRETHPETLIVTTKDCTHNEMIIRGLQFGCDVITEKPMTTDEVKCRGILDVEKQCGKKLVTAFNYRFSPRAEGQGVVDGQRDRPHHVGGFSLVSRYPPRGRLLPPLARIPEELGNVVRPQGHPSFRSGELVPGGRPGGSHALGELRNYGRNGKFRSRTCRGCPHQKQCRFHWDLTKDNVMKALYVDCESEDGYLSRRLRLPRRHRHLRYDDGAG